MDDEHNLLKTYTLCSKRVSTLSWAGSILTAGGKDTFVHLIDIRTRGRFNEAASFDAGAVSAGLAPPSLQTSSGRVLRLPEAGLRETCGLSWSDGARSLAVGSNNNRCLVWDAANLSRPRYVNLLCCLADAVVTSFCASRATSACTPLTHSHSTVLFNIGFALPSLAPLLSHWRGARLTLSCSSPARAQQTAACVTTTRRRAPC